MREQVASALLLFLTINSFSINAQVDIPVKDALLAFGQHHDLPISETEIARKLSEYQNFIYSDFMKNGLRYAANDSVSERCSDDMERVMMDFSLSESYATRSKYLYIFIF